MDEQPPTVDQAAHPGAEPKPSSMTGRPSPLLDTRIIYCGDNLEQLLEGDIARKLA
jgi:hypothetical protein